VPDELTFGAVYMKSPNDTIVLSAECAALIRRQVEMDHEAAGPKAPYTELWHNGIRIESRWDVLREFRVMQQAIDAIPELLARRISWMWCDSNCGAKFVVGVKHSLYGPELERAIVGALRAASGGYNGVTIEDGECPFTGETLADFDCSWDDPDV
jgi:hypothetical protein